jgi:hypothetical protein
MILLFVLPHIGGDDRYMPHTQLLVEMGSHEQFSGLNSIFPISVSHLSRIRGLSPWEPSSQSGSLSPYAQGKKRVGAQHFGPRMMDLDGWI